MGCIQSKTEKRTRADPVNADYYDPKQHWYWSGKKGPGKGDMSGKEIGSYIVHLLALTLLQSLVP